MTTAAYDGNGLRMSSTITPSGGTAATQDFVWDNRGQVPVVLMDSVNAYVYGGSGTPGEQVNLSTGAITYLNTDLIGSVRGIVSAAGGLTATTAYDAWGNPESAGGLTSYTPYGFAGGYTDSTGLIYLIDRYYDSAIGQFISVDPEVAQTLQPYAYASGTPIINTDPTGADVTYGPSRLGAPCADLHAWCVTAGWLVYQIPSGKTIDTDVLRLEIWPRVKKDRIDYRTNRMLGGHGLNSLSLDATILCLGKFSQ